MSDLAIMVDNIKLNIRVGMIFKYHDTVLLELPRRENSNSVIPGGRLKIDELRIDGIKREIKEELNFDLKDEKIVFKGTIENFFEIDNIKFHEFAFVYEYLVDDNDYQKLSAIKENQDNHFTDYAFIKLNDLEKVNLLPLEVRDIIRNK